MKKNIQLQVPEPCHENWNNMTSTQQGRFCMSCQKEVIDFSVMTDKEILAHISTASKSICGRAGNDQINRDLIMPAEPRKIWWKYWMGIAASLVMLSSRSDAQTKKNKPPTICAPAVIRMGTIANVQTEGKARIEIRGKIIDDNGNPVAYASISLKDKHFGTSADSSGSFSFNINADTTGIKLTVSSVGYQPKDIETDRLGNEKMIRKNNNGSVIDVGNIILTEQQMKEVQVIASQKFTGHLGGMVSCIRYTKFENAKIKIKDTLRVNEIKVYPNPVSAKGQFNISFNIKDQGEYVVQFIDASGRIVFGKQLNILSKNYTESFSGSMFAGSGIYFVNLAGKQNQKNYTTKLVVD
jgi:hypothetical protein